MLVKNADPTHVDVSVENSGGDEESLLLVVFLLVEVKNFLDSVRSEMFGHAASATFSDAAGARNFLHLLFGGSGASEVVVHEESLLHGPKSKVARLRIFGVVLVLRAFELAVQSRILVLNVLLVESRNALV